MKRWEKEGEESERKRKEGRKEREGGPSGKQEREAPREERGRVERRGEGGELVPDRMGGRGRGRGRNS